MEESKKCLNEFKEEISKLLIKQEIIDRQCGSPKMVSMKQTDFLKVGVKLIKLIENALFCK